MGVTPETAAGVSRVLRRLAWATLWANILLIVTGGAVRLTGSGLGCPTWPRCTDSSFTPHGTIGPHQLVEFGNRTLTFVLVGIAVATFVAARQAARDLGRPDPVSRTAPPVTMRPMLATSVAQANRRSALLVVSGLTPIGTSSP